MAAVAGPAFAQNKELSDKSVLTLMQYAWGMVPEKFTTPTGKTIVVDKTKASEAIVPLDMAREVIRVARLSAYAQLCELPEEQRANYQTLMRREEAKSKWTDQQMLFINQLHLFTVMTLTGKVQLVEKDGDKQVVVQESKAAQDRKLHRYRAQEGQDADHGLRELRSCPAAAAAAAARQPCRAKRAEPTAHQPEDRPGAALNTAGAIDACARCAITRARAGPLVPLVCTPGAPAAVRCRGIGDLSVPASLADRGGSARQFDVAIISPDFGVPRMTKRIRAKYKIDRRLGQNIVGPRQEPAQQARVRAPASTASGARPSSPTTASSCAPSRSSRATTATSASGSSARIYEEARRFKGSTSEHLIGLLERRLDAIVYRAKFVPTVFAARQFVSHGHVTVNGRRVNVPSFRCRVGDLVEVKEKGKQMTLLLEAIKSAERDVPDYIEADHSKMTAKLSRVPAPERRAVPGPHGAEPGGGVLQPLAFAPVIPEFAAAYRAKAAALILPWVPALRACALRPG